MMNTDTTINIEDIMNNVHAEVVFKVDDIQPIVTRIVEGYIGTSEFVRDIADEVDALEVAGYVADAIDHSDVVEAVADDIRYNYLDQIASYLSDSVSNFLMEGDDFATLVEDCVSRDTKALIAGMDERIAYLEKQLNVINNKKFKKFIKKITKGNK